MKGNILLKQIFEKYKCDKADHLYHEVYQPHFEPIKDQPLKILEVGIFKGVSMDSWHEYLPNATIYGIDIFTRLSPDQIPALKKDRIQWAFCDSTSDSVYQTITDKWGDDIKFDAIIDDGLHTPFANAKTFENLISFLKDDGVFYIEDVWPLDIMSEQEWNHSWMKKNKDKYNMKMWEVFAASVSDYKVVQHDLRKPSAIPDSYIYEIRK